MLEIIRKEMINEDFGYITARILNDEKVDKVTVKIRPQCGNRVIEIIVFYKSNRVATFDSGLSNHRIPIKYRNYIKEIMKEVE